MICIIFLFLMSYAVPAAAGDLALVDTQEAGGLEQLQDFMRKEDEKLKAIKMLDLDLTRADLELRKREIEVKLAGFNASPDAPASGIKVRGVMVNGDMHGVWMEVNGQDVHAAQGEYVSGGILLKSVKSNEVVLEHPDGKQEVLGFGS